MAEAMTVETILEADLLAQGFWTRMRFPFQTAGGGWSDIDVLGYHPERRELVLAESKVRGPKKHVYAFTDPRQDILDWDEDNYFASFKHIDRVCRNGIVFDDFAKMVRTLTIQHVSNYYVAPECMEGALKIILKRIRPLVPRKVRINIRLETTLDVICRVIAYENGHKQGRRYGHPVLDLARELNRYLHPDIRNAGRGRSLTGPIKKKFEETFRNAFQVVEN